MDDEKFWGIVDQINWLGLCLNETKPCAAGKARALKLLPTLEDAEAFRKILQKKIRTLDGALNEWENNGPGGRSFGVSDDGYDDLMNHIVGCGQEHYEAVLADPELAHKRSRAPYGTPEGYVESFSYCIPWVEDYDSAEVKLARAEKGLKYWIERLAAGTEDSIGKSEVERRSREVAELRALSYGATEVSPEEIQRFVDDVTRQVHESQVALLEEELAEVQKRLKKARKALDAL